MNIIIRHIKINDYPQISRLIQKTHQVSFGKIYPPLLVTELCKKYVPDKLAQKAQEIKYWLAEDYKTKKIVGIIGLKENELRTFFVDPDYQNQGIGKKLYQTLEAEAKSKGIKRLRLQGSPLGQPVYAKFGFKKIKEIEKERIGIKYTDAVMEKILA